MGLPSSVSIVDARWNKYAAFALRREGGNREVLFVGPDVKDLIDQQSGLLFHVPDSAVDRNLGSEFGESVPAVQAAMGFQGDSQ